MFVLLSALLSVLPLVLAYEPNENLVPEEIGYGIPYCNGAYIYFDSSFNAPEVQPLKWTVYNGTYTPRTQKTFAVAKNISDTPLYTKTLTPADYEIDPTSGTITYLHIADLPAGNFFNAYLSDSSSPPRIAMQNFEKYYVRHTASAPGAFPGTSWTCNRTRYEEKAYLPFDNASTLAFDKSAWPTSGGRTTVGATERPWWLAGVVGAVVAVGGGISL